MLLWVVEDTRLITAGLVGVVNRMSRVCAGILYGAITLLAGCATSAGDPAAAVAPSAQICKDPRPQVCTMDYRPVCANMEGGSLKTYANGCGACSVGRVIGWVEGACAE